MSKIQDSNVKSEAEVIADGGAKADLVNDSKIYVTANALNKRLDEAITDGDIGGGGGTENFIDNPDFKNDLTGWAAFGDGADLDGGTPTVTFTRNTTAPLQGDADAIFAKDAADRSGEGFRFAVTAIPDAAQFQVQLFSFDVLTSSGYVDDDCRVIGYDVTNSRLVRPIAGEFIKANSNVQKHYCQFQIADASSFRVGVIVDSARATAYNLTVDNFSFGRFPLAIGPVVTDTQEYTPSWTATGAAPVVGNGTLSGQFSRFGDVLKASISLLAGSTTTFGTGEWIFSLPSGIVIDTAKISAAFLQVGVGTASARDNGGTGNRETYQVRARTNNTVSIYGRTDAGVENVWNSGYPFTWGNSDFFTINFEVPILGWSSNAQISTDLGNSDIYAEGRGSNGAAITSLVTNINFTETKDTSNAFDGTTFVVPESGRYMVFGSISLTAAVIGAAYAFIDGVQDKLIGFAGSAAAQPFAGWLDLIKGQSITIRLSSNATLQNNTDFHHISFQKVATSQSILASETIAFRANSTAGQVLPNSGAGSAIGFENLDYDTLGGFNASNGTYVVPVSGYYSFYTVIGFGSANFAIASVTIDKNSAIQLIQGFQSNGFTRNNVSGQFFCEKGDVIRVTAAQLSGASRALETSANFVSFGGHKIK